MVITRFVLAQSEAEALKTPMDSPFVFDTFDRYPFKIPPEPYYSYEVKYYIQVIKTEMVREI